MTGAGLALAACGTKPRPQASTSGSEEQKGLCEAWGWEAERDPDNPTSNLPALAYKPAHIAILFIDFSQNWKLAINHASFGPDPALADDGKRLERALAALGERENLPGNLERRFANLKENPPYKRKSDNTTDRIDFSDFGFASQTELFIYFNSREVILNQHNLISFTPRSQDGDPRDKNFSYLAAKIVSDTGILPGRLVRVRNYMLDDSQKPIGLGQATKRQLYSMNIHFRLKSGGQNIPLVIDPDTGNGTGHEP
jgi:hypothetical protein